MLHRPIPEFLPSIYNNIGLNYDEKILPSIGNEVIIIIKGFKSSCCLIWCWLTFKIKRTNIIRNYGVIGN